MHGAWRMEHWSIEHEARSMEYGVWNMEQRSRSKEHGALSINI